MPRILVIDDEKSVCDAIAVILEADGFEVVTADNGRTGRVAFEQNQVDAIVLDIFMPEMDGIETIRLLRQQNPNVPIIAVSGALAMFDYRDTPAAPPDYLSMATKLGAVTAIHKPFKPRELVKAVRDSLRMAA
jgi:DNA-binding response OmpR family regulator